MSNDNDLEDNAGKWINALQGKTLIIYWTLYKLPEPVGVRELQR